IDADLLSQIKITFGVVPPVTGSTATVSGLDSARGFPRGPLAVFACPLDLMSRCGYAPEKSRGKTQSRRHGPHNMSILRATIPLGQYHRSAILRHSTMRSGTKRKAAHPHCNGVG